MWWLVVFILVDDTWTPGKDIKPHGWSPRAYESQELCLKRKQFALNNLKKLGRATTQWYCTQNKTASLNELKGAGETDGQ